MLVSDEGDIFGTQTLTGPETYMCSCQMGWGQRGAAQQEADCATNDDLGHNQKADATADISPKHITI